MRHVLLIVPDRRGGSEGDRAARSSRFRRFGRGTGRSSDRGAQHEDPAELAVDSIGGVLAVAVHGSLVGDGTEPLEGCLAQAMRGGRPVVLDLTGATAIDRRGIDALLDAHRRLATRLRIVVERGADLHQALRRDRVAHVLLLHGSRAEALAAASHRS